MSWVKLDDSMPDHPKVVGLCDRAFRVHVTGISYCARHLTDGEIPEAVGRSWGTRYVRELVLANLWHETDSGWEIHDYLDYNPSRRKVLAEREAAKERRGKHRRSSGKQSQNQRKNSGRSSASPTRPVPVPDPQTSNHPSVARDPNPNQPSQDQIYLAEQLGEAWGTDFSVKRIVLLNKMHGRNAVEDAMRELHGFPPEAGIRDLFAYITKTCELRANA